MNVRDSLFYACVVVVVLSLPLLWYLDDRDDRAIGQRGIATSETLAGVDDLALFSAQEALSKGDTAYVSGQLRKGTLVWLKPGTFYQVLKQFPGWLYIEANEKHYYIEHPKSITTSQPMI